MKRLALIVIIDGLNAKVFKEATIPYLKKLSKEGFFTDRCKSIYPSLTYPAHTSIVTGVRPNKHGIVGNAFLDRNTNEVLNLDFHDVNNLLQHNTIFDFAGKLQLKSIAINEPTTKGATFVFKKNDFDPIDYDKRFEMLKETVKNTILNERPDLLIVNFSNFDTIGENYGPFDKRVFSALEELDSYLAELEKIIRRIYNDYLIIVTSDHGMTSVEDYIDIKKELEDLALVLPSHRAVHIYLRGDKNTVISRLKELGFVQIYERNELSKIGLDNPRSGDIVAFAPRGVELEKRLKGSHGGALDEEMNVIFITNKKELVYEFNLDIIDSFKLARRFLIESYVIREVERKIENVDPGHGISHTIRVLRTVTKLGIAYNADLEALRLAALLHDVARKSGKEHSKESAKIAKKILSFAGLSEEKIQKIVKIIEDHHKDPQIIEDLESKILWDADKLDCLGVIGLVRALLESGFYGRDLDDAIDHVLRDTEEFLHGFHFNETKTEAYRRTKELKKVLEEIARELNS